jgi:hypothetical protein
MRGIEPEDLNDETTEDFLRAMAQISTPFR